MPTLPPSQRDLLLRRAVDEAVRLLHADGGMIYLYNPVEDVLRHSYDAGAVDDAARELLRSIERRPDQGMFGRAFANRESYVVGRYLEDATFEHVPGADDFVRYVGLQSMVVAPIVAENHAYGALGVFTARPDAFGEAAVALVRALADHAAAAIANLELIERLAVQEAELRYSEQRYRHLVQTSPDGVWQTDAEGQFVFWSAATSRLLGWPLEEVIGRHWGVVVDPASIPMGLPAWDYLTTHPDEVVRLRLDLRHYDGRVIPFEIAASSTFRDGAFAGAHGLIRDMTEQLRLEQELRDSEERYRFVVDNAPDIVWTLDAEGRWTYLSPSIEPLTGWKPSELIGHPFVEVVHESTSDELMIAWLEMKNGGATTRRARMNLRARDGRPVPIESNGTAIQVDGRLVGVHGVSRDLRPQVQLEENLRRHAAELAASQERSNLARELHDSVSQALFSMTLVTRSIEVSLERDLDATRRQIGILRELQRDALAEMRSLVFELRPGTLEQEGLVDALRRHAAALDARVGLPVSVHPTITDRLPDEVEEAFYRITQEALHNVVKHAGAASATVGLDRAGRDVRLTIDDDGAGFDPATVDDSHMGLAGMRARAERLGGRMAVRSRPGRGTRIEIRVPVAGREAPDAATPSDAASTDVRARAR